mmetsp:Transcript_11689/g.28382  ORF Transcript_11689/g.28382 Transcript_11689/m.28382 type:complete len:215 (+) Transcript_11689:695-1339(+)
MIPLEGDAFFTSAISPGWPVAASWSLIACTKSRGGGASCMAVRTRARGNASLRLVSSSSLYHTISSRMLMGLFTVLSTRSPSWLMASILKANWSVPTLCMDAPFGGRRRMFTSEAAGSFTDALTTVDMLRVLDAEDGRAARSGAADCAAAARAESADIGGYDAMRDALRERAGTRARERHGAAASDTVCLLGGAGRRTARSESLVKARSSQPVS